MTLHGATPPPDAGEPLWYLIGDLVISGLGAAGTIAATGVAVWLGVKASHDQQAQREEQERVQAEQVTIVRTWRATSPDEGGAIVVIRNDSSQPISNVRLVSVGAGRKDMSDERDGSVRKIDFLKPQGGEQAFIPELERSMMSAVEFDDVVGRTWVRTSEGQTIRVHKDVRSTCLEVEYSPTVPDVVQSIMIRPYFDSEPLPLLSGLAGRDFGRGPRVPGARARRKRAIRRLRRRFKQLERRANWRRWIGRLRSAVGAR